MLDLLATLYPYTKTIHIIAVISWMAGLLYLPRLFVNHTEKTSIGSEASEIFKGMEERLYRIIMRPAMIVTWIFGVSLAVMPGIVDWGSVYPYLKALFVLCMTGFHEFLGARIREFADDQRRYTARQWRLMNELPTLLMIGIVAMVVIRPF